MQYEKYKDAIQRIKDSSLTSSVYIGTYSQVFSKKDKDRKRTLIRITETDLIMPVNKVYI